MGIQSFGKEERLHSKKAIDRLFSKGSSFVEYPIRVIYMETETEPPTHVPVRILISAPKKRFKKAVDRNRIKRLIRETYRTCRQDLLKTLHEQEKYIAVAFVYIGSELPEYADLLPVMQKALTELKTRIEPEP